VDAAHLGDEFRTGAEEEVVGVVEEDLGPGGGDEVREDALDRAACADGHEGWGFERAVERGDAADSGAGGGGAGEDGERERG
jgi:hypothetical protein